MAYQQTYQQPHYGQPPAQGYGAPQYGAPPPSHPQQPPPAPYGSYPPPQGQQQSYAPPPTHSPYPPPQGAYGAPPTSGYPPQQQPGYPNAYGQPPAPQPPVQAYGTSSQPPAPSPYGAPPAQFGYPPQQQGYPPQQGSGYPPQQPNPYGAPQHPGAYGAPPAPPSQPAQPSLGYGLMPTAVQAGYDASHDAKALKDAMQGFGTDEKTLIRVLCAKDPVQMHILQTTFNRNYKDLIKYIKSETSGHFEQGLVGICRGPLDHDCELVYSAVKGFGTKEEILNDVLLGRSNADLKAIKSRYTQKFHGHSLDKDVIRDLSGNPLRLFEMVLGANRPEEGVPVNPQQVEQDVSELLKATEGKKHGTDVLLVCSIFANRSDAHLGAVAYTYNQRFKKDLEAVIHKELWNHPHVQRALEYMLRTGTDRAMRDAILLQETMDGLGTKDYLLTTRIVRMHWNRAHMANIMGAYSVRNHGKDLGKRVKSETSGNYQKLMLACMGVHGVRL